MEAGRQDGMEDGGCASVSGAARDAAQGTAQAAAGKGEAALPQAVRLRIASPGDAGGIAAIYRPYVEQTAVTFEYVPPAPSEMAERIARTLARYPYLVAESAADGSLLGYAYAGPYYGRAAYGWCCESSLYLRQGLSRQGLGTLLSAALEGALALQGLLSVYACIAVADCADLCLPDPYLPGASVPFHEARGFRQIGAFPQCGFKFGRWYGVVWMEKRLGPRTPDPLPVKPFPEARELVEARLADLSATLPASMQGRSLASAGR